MNKGARPENHRSNCRLIQISTKGHYLAFCCPVLRVPGSTVTNLADNVRDSERKDYSWTVLANKKPVLMLIFERKHSYWSCNPAYPGEKRPLSSQGGIVPRGPSMSPRLMMI